MKTCSTATPKILFTLALGLIFFAGFPSTLRSQGAGVDEGLQPGDLVQVAVWQREELSGEFTVAPDGSLNHPLYREIRVTGIPVSQVEERMRNFLSAFEANPQVVVQPLYRVAVAGSVMRPDIYNLPPGSTVAQAVNQAGGVTETGDRDDVRLFRGTTEIRLDLQETDAIRMPVQSGDQILVKSRTGGFLVPIIQAALLVANVVTIATNE